MKAISVKQPWAWLIANGYKDIENRTWVTNFRGECLIHASTAFDAYALHGHRLSVKILTLLAAHGIGTSSLFKMSGGIIGKCIITDCVDRHASEWFEGPKGFVITEAEPLDFRPLKGKLGFFDVAWPVQ